MRFQIIPIREGPCEAVFTHTSLFSVESSQKFDLVRNPKYGYEIASAQGWLLLWATSDAFVSLQKLSAKTSHCHWYPKGEGRLCNSWLSSKDQIPSEDSLSYARVCHSFTLMIVCTAICGSSFTCVKINTDFCMQPAAALIQAGRQPFNIHRGENTQVQWTMAVCKLFFFTTAMVLKHKWSLEMLQLLHRPVSFIKACLFRILEKYEIMDLLGLILKCQA